MEDLIVLKIFVGENAESSYNCDLETAIEICSKNHPNHEEKIQIYESDRHDRLNKLLAERIHGSWQYSE